MPEFNTIHALITTIEMTLFMRRDTIHSTTQTTRTLHKTQKHYHNKHIPNQSHLNDTNINDTHY